MFAKVHSVKPQNGQIQAFSSESLDGVFVSRIGVSTVRVTVPRQRILQSPSRHDVSSQTFERCTSVRAVSECVCVSLFLALPRWSRLELGTKILSRSLGIRLGRATNVTINGCHGDGRQEEIGWQCMEGREFGKAIREGCKPWRL